MLPVVFSIKNIKTLGGAIIAIAPQITESTLTTVPKYRAIALILSGNTKSSVFNENSTQVRSLPSHEQLLSI